MNKTYFAPTIGKDGNFYLRVVSSEEGEFGELHEKSGFLKFAAEAKAKTAYEALNDGTATANLGAEIGTTGLCKASISKVEIEVAAAA